jgi:hypothetical protein
MDMNEQTVDPTLAIARDNLWRIAQGVEDPKAAAKAALAELGVDYDAEQARINAQHAAEGCACAAD